MSKQDWNQSQYYQEDFLASHSVQPGSEKARKMTATSGQRCLELYKRSDPVGSLVRMLLASSVWNSTLCYLTWKASATPAKRLLFRLVPSMPHTEETGAQLLPTATAGDGWKGNLKSTQQVSGRRHSLDLPTAVRLWPTPTAEQCGMTATTGGRPIEKSTKLGTQVWLAEQKKLLPTPIASDGKNRGCKDYRKNRQGQLQTTIGGQLNPTWVEWLMGFPLGWTDLDASETLFSPSNSYPVFRAIAELEVMNRGTAQD